METAKVDIQKLQLLNDRISQTIDALNQVRQSVHGLQGSVSQPVAGIPQASYGLGLSHSGAFVPQGLAQMGYVQPGMVPTAFGSPGFSIPQVSGPYFAGGQPGVTSNPWMMQGLSHTDVIGRSHIGGIGVGADPVWQARLIQTFPNLRYEATGIAGF